MKLILGFLVLLGACSFKKDNQKLSGHEELYSRPEAPELASLKEFEQRIVIASTNDVQGNYLPQHFEFEDKANKDKQKISIGGIDTVKQYLDALRETYKNVVLVDSGDIFSLAASYKVTAGYYEELKYDAVTLGLRDFNLKVPSSIGNSTNLFKKFAEETEVPLLLSNLYELKTARGVEWKGTKAHLLKEVGGVKVGIIGLIPDDIVPQTPVQNRVGLFVENMLQSTLRHARLLRSLGADIIVVVTHQGVDCQSKLLEETKLPAGKINFDPNKENVCDLSSNLGQFLERLPPNLVDVVVGGRIESKMANQVNGIVLLSGFSDGKSLNMAELIVDTKSKKVIKEKTQIHQPVYFCHEFFKETSDCYYEDASVDHSKKIPATFLGKPITIQKTTASHIPDTRPKWEVTPTLNKLESDIAFAPESSGDTQLMVVNVNGKDLRNILEEDFNNHRKDFWKPSPFIAANDEVTISISGLEVKNDETYQILSDLESLQQHPVLAKRIALPESQSLVNMSWNSEEDTIAVQMSAISR